MANEKEIFNVSPGLVRRLLRENRTMGKQLAEYEFKGMLRELVNPTTFTFELDFPGGKETEPLSLPTVIDDSIASKLPHLNVNTGSILYVQNPQLLMPIGIHIPDIAPEDLGPALKALMTAHVSDPFARFVFLCDTFRPIPFLGRYKFVYEYLGRIPIELAAKRAAYRYGIKEVRSLIGTQLVWSDATEG